jgi:hypothetical protein
MSFVGSTLCLSCPASSSGVPTFDSIDPFALSTSKLILFSAIAASIFLWMGFSPDLRLDIKRHDLDGFLRIIHHTHVPEDEIVIRRTDEPDVGGLYFARNPAGRELIYSAIFPSQDCS